MPSQPRLPSSRFSARSDSGLRAPAVSKTVILSVNASLTHGGGGLCRPLQLYFVLNEWVIRRPVVQRAPTGRGPHGDIRRKNRGLSDIHWQSVARLCKNTESLLETKLTTTLDFNMGW